MTSRHVGKLRLILAMASMPSTLVMLAQGEETLALKSSQSVISTVLVANSDRGPVGRMSRLTLTATLTPNIKEASTLKVNQSAGEGLLESLDNVRQRFTVSHGQWPNGYLFEYGFEQAGRPQDGASTGLAMSVLLDSLFTGRALDSDWCMTGAITPAGQTTTVRSVIEKIEAAQRAGMKGIVVPTGSERAIADLVLLKGPRILYQIEIVSAATVAEGTELMAIDRPAKTQQARVDFVLVQNYLRARDRGTKDLRRCLKDPLLQKGVQKVTRAMSNHLSAKLIGLSKRPGGLGRLSLLSSYNVVQQVYDKVRRLDQNPDKLSEACTRLEDLEAILHTKAFDFARALSDLIKRRQDPSTENAALRKAARDVGTQAEILQEQIRRNQPELLLGIGS